MEWLTQFLHDAQQINEQDTDRPGAFSYAGEFHSATIGLFVGITCGLTGEWVPLGVLVGAIINEEITAGSKAIGEFIAEPWYGGGAAVIGVGIGLALRPVV